ncbi:hypothetical protein AB204_02335 [Xenorhabdus khoisanae]|uniref:Uncharacterized protein n=1 Tax=Xenorhabdus khoisanae TaxID=880157 RepID=A0A0J5FWV1_9GAMM|nr:hypothetical protein [Xenorhabdus khoisanae]KMJ46679.1 hypothetical protein AB204_02335 [Xenorhabdus khoisanae]
MDAFSDSIFEAKYKEFLKVRSEWLKIVFKHAVYTDINTQGEACRPVAILADQEVLHEVETLLLAWQQFAAFAEHKRAAGLSAVSSQIYLPVPAILRNVNSFTIGAFESSATVNFVREEILRKIDKKLNQLHRTKNKDHLTITELELDKELIGFYPEGTRFRRRTTGYRDIVLDIGGDESYRVGAYGVIVDGNSLTQPDAYDINTGDKYAVSDSYYNMISPVRCSLFAGSSLYLIEKIEEAKQARNTVSRQKLKESRKQTYLRRRDQDLLDQQRAQQEAIRLNKIAVEKQKAQRYGQQKKRD